MKTVIFAGGNGSRLWPVSRISSPKQFQQLIGDKTLFELTVERMLKSFSLDDIYIVIPELYKEIVKSIIPDMNDDHIIIEPCKWDTLACIGYAAFKLFKQFPEENLFLAWSDHIIKDEARFLKIIEAGNTYATTHNKVIKIGAKALYPEVNWGYIKFGDQVDELDHDVKIYTFEHHYEKPNYETAKRFVSSFEYLWNMGYMLWPAKKLIDAYKEYSPHSYDILTSICSNDFNGDLKSQYMQINKTSVDFEILEQVNKDDFVVIPADVGWNDLGDWASLKSQLETEKKEVVKIGKTKKVYTIDTEDTIVYGSDEGKVICLVGMSDIAIIDTKDALLVVNKKKSKDVKKIVEQIKELNPELL